MVRYFLKNPDKIEFSLENTTSIHINSNKMTDDKSYYKKNIMIGKEHICI